MVRKPRWTTRMRPLGTVPIFATRSHRNGTVPFRHGRVVGQPAVVLMAFLCLAACGLAQEPAVHYWHAGVMPPGAIGSRQLQRGGPLPGYFQPVEIKAPPGVSISLAVMNQFVPTQPAPRRVGLLIGSVYRLRVISGGDIEDFRRTVRAFHEAGIEVILDVVFNHTGEGDELGPTFSFRGIDNASYYCLAGDRRHYQDHTGCGNTLNAGHPRVQQMVMDSLRYWERTCMSTVSASTWPSAWRARTAISRQTRCSSPASCRIRARRGEVHRGTLGFRTGRLSGRWLSAALERMERQVSQRRAQVLARRRRPCRRSRVPAFGISDMFDCQTKTHRGREFRDRA